MKQTQSSWPVKAPLALVLTSGILITSCSQAPQKAKSECFSPLVVVCAVETKAKVSKSLTSPMTFPLPGVGSILP